MTISVLLSQSFANSNKDQKMKPGTQIPSSTGGTITFTKTGLIHTAGRAYSGQMAQMEAQAAYKVKKTAKKT